MEQKDTTLLESALVARGNMQSMYRDPFQSQKFNLIAIAVVVIGGALLLWLVLHYAFSVTSGLLQPTPPI